MWCCCLSLKIMTLKEGFKKGRVRLARWLSWLDHHPVYQKVVGSFPRQSAYIGCGFDPCNQSMFPSGSAAGSSHATWS